MTTRTKPAGAPRRAPRPAKTNRIGLEKTSYRGRPSTLCKGCGHDSISQRIVNAAWEMGLDQTQVVKLSGIGCSSKTPAYYLGWSHGFNSLHGRMPSVATGAIIANTDLQVIGVSGDGDSASIGIGQFKHAVRRNLPLVYIVENNGVYGLTKGQFSATADEGQFLKYQGGKRSTAAGHLLGGADSKCDICGPQLCRRSQAAGGSAQSCDESPGHRRS